MPVIKYKNRCIKFKNKAADVRNRFELTLEQTNGGLLSSNKFSGWWNDEVTLYNTPIAHYDFNGYSITGSTLYDNNKFKFNGSSVSAEAIFTPWPVRNVSLVQTSGGTINATPMTGYDGDTVVLTNEPAQGYDFVSYELTGSTLYDNNKFDFNGANVSVKCAFKAKGPSSGWTIRTTGTSRVAATMDPALGESKIIYETVTQLNDDLSPKAGGFVSSFLGQNVWWNDQYAAFAPSAGIYNSVWDNANEYSSNTGNLFCNFGQINTANITDIYTMDFFNQQKTVYGLPFFKSTSSLPQDAEYILNATRITALVSSFSGYSNVKTPVIPFITACLAAMPNLVSIKNPLRNSCSASPDYQEARTLYPNWF